MDSYNHMILNASNRLRRLVLLFVLSFCWLHAAFVPASAQGDPAPGTPAFEVKNVIDVVSTTVKGEKGKLEESVLDAKLKDIIMPIFNFEEMSRRSLGPDWNKAKPEEREEFVQLFSDLLARTYLRRIRRNAEDAKILRIQDTIDGKNAVVRSVVDSQGQEVLLDYRMRNFDGKWKIYDVIIENIGLVSNYRSEFPGIIRKEGFGGLLQRLRDRQHEQEEKS